MKASKQYLRFCGIDMAKQKHVACIIDQDGRYLLRPKSTSAILWIHVQDFGLVFLRLGRSLNAGIVRLHLGLVSSSGFVGQSHHDF